jgi:hypothetical protein
MTMMPMMMPPRMMPPRMPMMMPAPAPMQRLVHMPTALPQPTFSWSKQSVMDRLREVHALSEDFSLLQESSLPAEEVTEKSTEIQVRSFPFVSS